MTTKTKTNDVLDFVTSNSLKTVLSAYAQKQSGITPDYYVKQRADGPYLVIVFAYPTEEHYHSLNEVIATLPEDNVFKERTAIQKRSSAPTSRLELPETKRLQTEISENLTFTRDSFDSDFFTRYTPSMTGAELQIVAKANYAVYGRRGAGKSSLLAFAMHTSKRNGEPYAWVALQTFTNRADKRVVPAVIAAVFFELSNSSCGEPANSEFKKLGDQFLSLSEGETEEDVLEATDRFIFRARQTIAKIATKDRPVTIFLDDVHVISETMQPSVLGYLYKIARGNNVLLKMSGIGQLTRLYDAGASIGLQPTHDIQILTLDLNLTIPKRAEKHIVSILDSHAKYCGLPGVRYIAGEAVLARLVLVAAGVPRDALNIFSLSISKAASHNRRVVAITDVNAAASETAEEKLKDVEQDSSSDAEAVKNILNEVKDFCILKIRKNAFLVEIKNGQPRYNLVQKLVSLRLVHLLHEGITPHRAGKRFIALMLDYGFYVGIRAARSVELIPSSPRAIAAKEFRSLPIFQ